MITGVLYVNKGGSQTRLPNFYFQGPQRVVLDVILPSIQLQLFLFGFLCIPSGSVCQLVFLLT